MCDTQIQLELLFAKNSGLLEKGITNRSLAFNHFLSGGNSSVDDPIWLIYFSAGLKPPSSKSGPTFTRRIYRNPSSEKAIVNCKHDVVEHPEKDLFISMKGTHF